MAARELMSRLLPHILDELEPNVEESMILDHMQNDPIRDTTLMVLSQLSTYSHNRDGNLVHCKCNGCASTNSHSSQCNCHNNSASGTANGDVEPGSTDSESDSLTDTTSASAMILPHTLNPNNFHDLFRMPRSTFEELMQVTMNDPSSPLRNERVTLQNGLPKPETCLMVTLYFLGTRHMIEEVGNTFQISKRATQQAIQKVTVAISRLVPTHVRWPSPERAAQIQQSYSGMGSLPGVVGAVGILHVGVNCPACRADQYQGPSGSPCLLLQAVSDHSLSFLHCCCGWPGKTPPHRAFMDSDLYQDAIRSPEQFFSRGSLLVGGKHFPLTPWLLTPLPQGNLTEAEETYNTRHQVALQTVNSALDLLQVRFPRLKLIDAETEEELVRVVMVCCGLHNFCRRAGDTEYFIATGTEGTPGLDLGPPFSPDPCPGGVAKCQEAIASLHSS